jgi:hypothetical protein
MDFSDETLKTLDELLKLGGSISIPYKKKLLDWYADNGLTLLYMGNEYVVSCLSCGINKKCDTIKEAAVAFEFYTHPKNNIGLAYQMVMSDHPEINFDAVDHPSVTRKVKAILKQEKYNW